VELSLAVRPAFPRGPLSRLVRVVVKLTSESIPRSLHRSLASQAEKGEKQKRMCARHEGKDSVRGLLEKCASFVNQRAAGFA